MAAAAVAAGKRNVAIVEREPPKRVVIVDDDRDTRERLQQILEKSGWSVALAPSGLRLLSLLEVDRPDVILLDIAMSWINGFELCRAMKANTRITPTFPWCSSAVGRRLRTSRTV